MPMRHATIAGGPRHLSGWRREPVDHRDQKLGAGRLSASYMPAAASIQRKADLRVENQYWLGSCTCNSGTSALEYLLPGVQLSRLAAYAWVRQFEGTPLAEDSGAFVRDVMKVLASRGCPLEQSWQYDPAKFDVPVPSSLEPEAYRHRAGLYLRCPDLETVKASIWQGFPVVGGFDCPPSISGDHTAMTGEVLEFASGESPIGGHAILFTAFDDRTRRVEFLNSWGEAWGVGGYGTLPYSYFDEGRASDFWTIRSTL